MLQMLLAVILLATTLTTYTQPTAIQVQEAHGTSTSALTITFTQAPTVNDLILCSAAHTAGSGATLTWPTGYTTLDTQKNVGTSLGGAMAYRVVQAGDPSSYSLGTSTTVGALSVGCVEYAYVSTSQPIMSDACFTNVSPGTTASTPSQTPSAPTIGASFFAAVGNVTTSPGAQTFTNYDVNVGSGALQVHSQHGSLISAFQSAYNASLGYSASPSAAVGCTVLLNPTITPFTVSAVMPVATPTPSPTPSPTPTPSPSPTPTPGAVYPYAPSYVYMGNASSGQGGNDCNSAAPPNVQQCITGPMIKNVNIRYVEGGFTNSNPSLNGSTICNDGQYCHYVAYQTINNAQSGSNIAAICAGLDAEANATNPYASSGTDPGYLHTGTPTSDSNRVAYTNPDTHTCSQLALGEMYLNPRFVTGTNNLESLLLTDWFNNSAGPNGDTNIYTIWDNSVLFHAAEEYPQSTVLTQAEAYMTDYYSLFATYSTYPQGFNGLGSQGYYMDGIHSSGYYNSYQCDSLFRCNNPQTLCADNSHHQFKFVQSERLLTSGGKYSDSTYWVSGIADVLDTASVYASAANCANAIDLVFLNQPMGDSAGGATYSYLILQQQLALRILTEPSGYNGAENAAGPMLERYEDCYASGAFNYSTSCNNQVAVWPMDGIQFIPLDTGWTALSCSNGCGNGSGCSTTGTQSGMAGGAAAFNVACLTTNSAGTSAKDAWGYAGAIYARAGTVLLYGVNKGTGIEIADAAGGASGVAPGYDTIPNSLCHIDGLTKDCSQYAFYWDPIGRGPQTCYEDLGTNLGTSSATCNSGDTLTPAANGGQSAAHESAWNGTAKLTGVPVANALGECPGPLEGQGTSTSPTKFTMQCTVLLMSQ